MSIQSIGYVDLLRNNKAFRRLWYGQVISQLGDWFDSIALFALLLRLTGSGQAVGLLMVAQFVPAAVVGLFAGVIIDRLPRKLVMIAANLGSAVLVLLFLLVRDASQIWIIYLVAVLKMSLVSFFDPARTAITPDVVNREELIAANAISGATWSAMLAIGAALGGRHAGHRRSIHNRFGIIRAGGAVHLGCASTRDAPERTHGDQQNSRVSRRAGICVQPARHCALHADEIALEPGRWCAAAADTVWPADLPAGCG